MDREKVIEAVEEAFDLVHSDFIGTDDFNETEWEQNKADALALLQEQEAKTGHWNGPECSRCHAILEREPRFFKYCPYCGAKMESD